MRLKERQDDVRVALSVAVVAVNRLASNRITVVSRRKGLCIAIQFTNRNAARVHVTAIARAQGSHGLLANPPLRFSASPLSLTTSISSCLTPN